MEVFIGPPEAGELTVEDSENEENVDTIDDLIKNQLLAYAEIRNKKYRASKIILYKEKIKCIKRDIFPIPDDH